MQRSRQLLEEHDLFAAEGVDLGRVDQEEPEGDPAPVPERQPDGRAEAALRRLVEPRRELRGEGEVLGRDGPAAADGHPGGATPARAVTPGEASRRHVPLVDAGVGHRADARLLVPLQGADPGHAVARPLADDPADLAQQGLLVRRPDQQLVALADGAELPVEAVEGLLGPLPVGDLPREVGQERDGLHVLVVVGGALVAHPEDGDDPPAPHHRNHELPDDLGMARRHSAAVGKGGEVVVDHRRAPFDAVHPDAGVGDRVVAPLPRGPAEGGPGPRRPRLERQRALIVVDEVEEADEAVGDLLRLVDRLLHELVARV